MAKSRETFNKREKEKKKQKKKEEKAKRKEERKANSSDSSFEDMIMYVDENGNFTSTPPDPTKRMKIDASTIAVSVPKQVEEEGADDERNGVVTHFNTEKGYGFIRDLKSQESIFTHINSHLEPIGENDKVSFRVEQGPKGLNAVDVRLTK